MVNTVIIPEVLYGLGLGLSLIIPIGTQNMYIIRQGALGKHPYAAAITCTCCDLLLIAMGAMGVGGVIANSAPLRIAALIGGVGFLSWYGIKSARRAWAQHTHTGEAVGIEMAADRKTVIMTGIAFSLLNPHAILDTTVLIGGLAGQRTDPDLRLSFTLGAMIASTIWFFALSTFARYLKPLFQHPTTARLLDGFVALLMWGIALQLIRAEFTT